MADLAIGNSTIKKMDKKRIQLLHCICFTQKMLLDSHCEEKSLMDLKLKQFHLTGIAKILNRFKANTLVKSFSQFLVF